MTSNEVFSNTLIKIYLSVPKSLCFEEEEEEEEEDGWKKEKKFHMNNEQFFIFRPV